MTPRARLESSVFPPKMAGLFSQRTLAMGEEEKEPAD